MFKINQDISDMGDEELIEAYADLTGELNHTGVSFTDKLIMRARLEDMEDAAEERGLDL